MKHLQLSLLQEAEFEFTDALIAAQGPLYDAVMDIEHRDADECVQMILVKAWEKRQRFDPSTMDFATWLWGIARWALATMEKDRSQSKSVINIADIEDVQGFDLFNQRFLSPRTRLCLQKCSANDDRATSCIDTGSVYMKVVTLMDENLSPTARQALELLSEGHARKDIAETLGISMGSLRGHLQRARTCLRTLLAEDNGGRNGDGHRRNIIAA